jgi:hypothetical protein
VLQTQFANHLTSLLLATALLQASTVGIFLILSFLIIAIRDIDGLFDKFGGFLLSDNFFLGHLKWECGA